MKIKSMFSTRQPSQPTTHRAPPWKRGNLTDAQARQAVAIASDEPCRILVQMYPHGSVSMEVSANNESLCEEIDIAVAALKDMGESGTAIVHVDMNGKWVYAGGIDHYLQTRGIK